MRFSILLASRNRPEWVKHAIASVIGQTYHDWELILLDNSDEPYRDIPPMSRICHRHELCDGVAHAYSLAAEMATGDVLVPLGDDDLLPPDCLETSVLHFGDAKWLCGQTAIRNEAGATIAMRGGDQDSVAKTLAGNYWLGGAVHWRRELTEDGSFLSEYEGAADFDLYLRFIRTAPPVLVPKVMYLYTDWPGTDSNQRAANQAAQSSRIAAQTH